VTSCINVDVLKKDDIPIIVEELIKTSGGLCNLIFTYSDDSTVESSLTLIIEQIGRFVEKYGSEKDKQEFKKRCSVLENERANAQIADALEVEEVDSELDQTI
jgi:hypothetical protein